MPPLSIAVFDVGNVLIRWEPRLLFGKIFADPARRDWFLAEICTEAWNREMDRGRPFADGIAERVARHPEWADEIRAFDERWHEMVPGTIEGSVALLGALRARGVPTYAVTNFSAEKWAECLARFAFLAGFRDVVVSAHERLLKPDPAIFRVLVERNGLDPSTCFFVDDVAANVEGARAAGMSGAVFTTPARLAVDLAARGLLPA